MLQDAAIFQDAADSLQASVCKLRALHKRRNGDMELLLPVILREMEADVARLRGLSRVRPGGPGEADASRAFQTRQTAQRSL